MICYFFRNKSGIWGWRSDKVEEVNGHECKVFAANNVELITKTRTEHLAEPDKAKAKAPKTPLQSFLGIAESEERIHSPTSDDPTVGDLISNTTSTVRWGLLCIQGSTSHNRV
jgi:hypothetical protein